MPKAAWIWLRIIFLLALLQISTLFSCIVQFVRQNNGTLNICSDYISVYFLKSMLNIGDHNGRLCESDFISFFDQLFSLRIMCPWNNTIRLNHSTFVTYPCFYIIQPSLSQCELFWHKYSLDDTRSCYQSFLGSAIEPKFKTFLVHESLLVAISPSSNPLDLLDKKIIFIYLKVIPLARPEVSIIGAIRKWLTSAVPALIPAGPGIWELFF